MPDQPIILLVQREALPALAERLQKHGVATRRATNVSAAFESRPRACPTAILLSTDGSTPQTQAVCRELRAVPAFACAPIVRISPDGADGKEGSHVCGRDGEPDAWLPESFAVGELLAFARGFEAGRDGARREPGLQRGEVQPRTASSEAEQKLHASLEHYQHQVRLFEAITSTTPDFVYLFDLAGRFLYANRRLLEVWGMKLSDIIGKTCLELGYEAWHHNMHMREIAEVIQTKHPIKGEVPFKAPLTGVFGIYEYIFSPVLGPDGQVEFIAGTTRDVTQRKHTEQLFRTQSELLSGIIDNIPVLLCIWNAKLEVFRCNKHFRDVLGWTEQDVMARDFLTKVYPDPIYRQKLSQYMVSLEKGWLDVKCASKHDGVIDISWANVRLSDGTSIGIGIDMRERLQREAALRLAQEQLRRHAGELEEVVQERTAKLRETVADLEQFSYSLAHDLRAPLRSMNSFATLLLEEMGSGLQGDRLHYLKRIVAGARRMDDLIRDVLSYTTVARLDLAPVPVELDPLVRDIIAEYPHLQPQQGDIEIAAPLPTVLGNPALITQCISNLLGNAVKFVPPGVRPKVTVWSEVHEHFTRVLVRDNGIGIDASQMERIWRLFERGHHESDYPGTGIGLSVVKRAAERMGGSVGVESEPGRGSTFWFEVRNA